MAKFDSWHTHSRLPFCSLKMANEAENFAENVVAEDADPEESKDANNASINCSIGSIYDFNVA